MQQVQSPLQQKMVEGNNRGRDRKNMKHKKG